MVQQLGQVTPECTFLAAEELAFAEDFTDVLFYCLFIMLLFPGLLFFSTMRVLTSILTVINMSGVANLVI